MDSIHRRVARFLRASGVSRATPILVAVSGGADSVALLRVLCALGQRVGAAHVHHGLRGPDADGDQAWVSGLAQALGVPFRAAAVSAGAAQGQAGGGRAGSPEARARVLRYRALEQLRVAGGYAWVATGHTLEDQAETVLLRAIRGTDLAGLGSIAPMSAPRHLLRPLLDVRRAELRAYLSRRSTGASGASAWREDGSNLDLRIPRNRIRRRVLGELEAAHPGALLHLAQLADAAREWRVAEDRQLARWRDAACQPGEGGVWIDRRALAGCPVPGRRALLAQLLDQLGAGERITRAHLERADTFLEDAPSGRSLSLPCGLVLVRDFDRHWLGPAPGPRPPCAVPPRSIRPGGELVLPERGLRLHWGEASTATRAPVRLTIPEPAPAVLHVRSPRASDHLGREDRAGGRRLMHVLSGARWPRRVRQSALVVEDDTGIRWVVALDGQAVEGKRDWRILANEHQCSSRRVIRSEAGSGARWELCAERVSRISSTW